MKPFRRVAAPAVVLDRTDLDTDQIIPKQFLKRIERTGYGEFLFFDWRYTESGGLEPDFELNDPRAAGAKILVAGSNFGCGSSREHAAWALQDYGFEVVIAPSFGDIFATNAMKNGLVPVVLPPDDVRLLMAEASDGARMVVDLEALTVVSPSGRELRFELDPFRRDCLLNGLDDIELTLRRASSIALHEDARRPTGDTRATAQAPAG